MIANTIAAAVPIKPPTVSSYSRFRPVIIPSVEVIKYVAAAARQQVAGSCVQQLQRSCQPHGNHRNGEKMLATSTSCRNRLLRRELLPAARVIWRVAFRGQRAKRAIPALAKRALFPESGDSIPGFGKEEGQRRESHAARFDSPLRAVFRIRLRRCVPRRKTKRARLGLWMKPPPFGNSILSGRAAGRSAACRDGRRRASGDTAGRRRPF